MEQAAEDKNKQLQDELDALRAKSGAYNPTTSYFDKMKALQSQKSSLSYDDISSRADELSALMPQTKPRGLYGMATDLSRGLVKAGQAGSRAPVGAGLAMGFNLYSEAESLRKQKQADIRAELMQMAYRDVEKKREEARALDAKMLDVNFKYEVEQIKNNGSYFPGTGDKSTMMNWLMQGARMHEAGDNSFLSSWQYKLAWNELQREKIQQLPDGRVYKIPGAAWVKDYPDPIDTEDGNPTNEPGAVSGASGAGGSPQNISALSRDIQSAGFTNVEYQGTSPTGVPVFTATDSDGKQQTIQWLEE